MRKVVFIGHGTNGFYYNKEIETIYKEDEIKVYLEQKAPEAREIFIDTHGNQHFPQKNLTLTPSLLLQLSINTNEFAHNILSKIVQNTEENKLNIVHIMSCYSGTAQHTLKDVNGNIVVCTYAPADHSTSGHVVRVLINTRNNFDNLKEFIVKSLPLLTAVGFSISYKLDENIYSLNFDNSNIKRMDLNSFSEFLQEQYIKVQEFYTDLQKKFINEYPELFPNYCFPEKVFYSTDELKQAFNLLLNLDSTKLNIEEVEHILEIDSSYLGNIMHYSIKNKRKDIIEKIINKIEKVECSYLNSAIEFDDLETLNSLIYKTEEVDHNILTLAIEGYKIRIVETLINSNKIKEFTNDNLMAAITTNNLPILEILLSNRAEVEDHHLYYASKTPEIFVETLELLFDKTKETSAFLNNQILLKSIKENSLSLTNKVISRMSAFDITDEILDLAIENGNSDLLKTLLNKMASTNSLIQAVNSNDLSTVEELLKKQDIKVSEIAAIILSENIDMVIALEEKVGNYKVLITALKLGNSFVVQNILNEIEDEGNLDDSKLNEIFKIAAQGSNGNVIEDIMDKMLEVTDKHLIDVINIYTPERNFIFEKVYNKVEKIESRFIEKAVNSEVPYIVQKVVEKVVDVHKDFFLNHYLLEALGSSNIFVSISISLILLDNIEKVCDEHKYDLLDLTAKGNSYGIKNLYLFEKILDKAGFIDEEHLNSYLKLVDPSMPVFEKLNTMLHDVHHHTAIETNILADDVIAIGEDYFTAD